jgi:hypothetical protein
MVTPQFEKELSQRTTMWQWRLFSAGQFASSVSLNNRESLLAMLREETGFGTIFGFPYHDQPGLNLSNQTHLVVVDPASLSDPGTSIPP